MNQKKSQCNIEKELAYYMQAPLLFSMRNKAI